MNIRLDIGSISHCITLHHFTYEFVPWHLLLVIHFLSGYFPYHLIVLLSKQLSWPRWIYGEKRKKMKYSQHLTMISSRGCLIVWTLFLLIFIPHSFCWFALGWIEWTSERGEERDLRMSLRQCVTSWHACHI